MHSSEQSVMTRHDSAVYRDLYRRASLRQRTWHPVCFKTYAETSIVGRCDVIARDIMFILGHKREAGHTPSTMLSI